MLMPGTVYLLARFSTAVPSMSFLRKMPMELLRNVPMMFLHAFGRLGERSRRSSCRCFLWLLAKGIPSAMPSPKSGPAKRQSSQSAVRASTLRSWSKAEPVQRD